MKNGDLSNEVSARILVVFEGLAGYLEPGHVGRYNELGSSGDWDAAIGLWDLNPLALARMTYLAVRRDVRIEVVTFVMPPDGAHSLAERLDEENVPVTRVTSSSASRMARSLAYGIDIARVYCADYHVALMCGSKGRHVTSGDQIGS